MENSFRGLHGNPLLPISCITFTSCTHVAIARADQGSQRCRGRARDEPVATPLAPANFGNDIHCVMAAYFLFTCMVKTNVGIMIPLCFVYFKTWVCTLKLIFYNKCWKKCIILGYNNRRPVSMAAILNKKSSTGILVLSEHLSNFPENFNFLHFFPVWTLLLLGYPGCSTIIRVRLSPAGCSDITI